MIVSPKLTVGQRVYLNFVRAAAALSVLLGHSATAFLQNSRLQKANIQIGAVPIFFLLSGFLISLSVFQKHADKTYGFRDYFIDRFCRIYCVFFPALVFVLLVDWQLVSSPFYAWKDHFNIQTWIGNLFMLQDFPLFQVARRLGVPDNSWFVSSFASAGPFWTISIEWWIYMLFGFLIYFRVRSNELFKLWQWVFLGFLAIEPVYHFVGGPDRCLTMLWVIGMATSLFFLRLPSLSAPWIVTPRRWQVICISIFIASIFALIAHAYANMYHQQNPGVYHQTDVDITEFQSGLYLAIGVFSLLFAFGTVNQIPTFLEKTISFIAGYSYSLYLVHSSILMFITIHNPGRDHDPKLFWTAIAISNAVAIVFWWLFERHHRALAERIKLVLTRRQQAVVNQAV